jgi:O-antigen ligase
VTRRLIAEWPTLVLGGLFAALLVMRLSADDSIRAPWSGLMVAVMAVLLVALGAVGRGWGIGLAVLGTIGATLVWFPSAGSEPSESCARECGIPLWGFLALVVPVAALIAALGAGVGHAWRGRRPAHETGAIERDTLHER